MGKKRCEICQRYRADIPVDGKRFICLDCDLAYLYGVQDKAKALDMALELVQNEKLSFRQALKVAAGRRCLDIEKEMNMVRRKKDKGQSIDVYQLGKRQKGHYNG